MRFYPYYFKKVPLKTKTLGRFNQVSIHILLEDGMRPWEENPPSGTPAEVCEYNDMVVRRCIISDTNELAWIQIDEEKTALDDFFTYEETRGASVGAEVPAGALLWRTWNILVDGAGALAFVPIGFPLEMTNRIGELISTV
jgi:L-alanine-DL-glutamate epimerase-like enolase superfamily enzyme